MPLYHDSTLNVLLSICSILCTLPLTFAPNSYYSRNQMFGLRPFPHHFPAESNFTLKYLSFFMNQPITSKKSIARPQKILNNIEDNKYYLWNVKLATKTIEGYNLFFTRTPCILLSWVETSTLLHSVEFPSTNDKVFSYHLLLCRLKWYVLDPKVNNEILYPLLNTNLIHSVIHQT